MSKGSLHDSDSCLRTETTPADLNSVDSPGEQLRGSRQEPKISSGHDFNVLTMTLRDWAEGPFQLNERRLQLSNTTATSQALNTIEFEIFKITEMARRWIVENGLSPYKLALTTGTSPSQVHRIMEPDWTPSLKLARRIASSLPDDWVSMFERDCNACLPRIFHLHPSPYNSPDPVTRLLGTLNGSDTTQVVDSLVKDRWSVRHHVYLSRAETEIFVADHTASDLIKTDYTPPLPRMVWTADANGPQAPNCALLLHRIPLKIGTKLKLFTVHIAEYTGKNWATQFWRIEGSRDLTSHRQMDILKAFLAEKT
ncbi:hypothetical protein [Nisaea sp.]|uniref:hypothetical protein n=1 Tax=Nisaea sp. TaxID=2024842 RepID=UPI00326567BD